MQSAFIIKCINTKSVASHCILLLQWFEIFWVMKRDSDEYTASFSIMWCFEFFHTYYLITCYTYYTLHTVCKPIVGLSPNISSHTFSVHYSEMSYRQVHDMSL